MVNKPHAPRSSKSTKKPPVAGLNGEDTSFIVFGSDKGGKKSKQTTQTNQASQASATGSKDKANAAATGASEPPKKPDTRTLVAGASWTGKLPMTLFSELCQKQKWEKPEYNVFRNAKGYAGEVIIRQKNPKTQEITVLPPLAPPRSYQNDRGAQPSAVEARHFAAAYALFRVRNATSMHSTLPPQYRDLWKGDFAELKKDACDQGRQHEYEADPFLAHKRYQDARAAVDKARADKEKQRAAEQKSQVIGLDGNIQNKHSLKGWQRVPRVEMGAKARATVEHLIRTANTWNPHGIKLSTEERRQIVNDLANSGFRKSHIEEATDICKDKEECIEWLLIHIPEDDLPGWALPENYTAGVSLASGDLKREAKIGRLSSAGYAKDLCVEALDVSNGDEDGAARSLQRRLLDQVLADTKPEPDESQNIWLEELSTLEAIFGDRYSAQDTSCTITLEQRAESRGVVTLRARRGLCYPYEVPVLAIEADLPAYIRLSILKQCLLHANETLLGEQMLYSIVDWLESHLTAIVDNPGRLSDVATAISSDIRQMTPRYEQRTRRHPRPLTWQVNSTISQEILKSFTSRQRTTEQQRMLTARQALPAWHLQQRIVECVTQNQVTIISGETGSGKSTQSVQFILDDLIQRGLGESANIICTQPRRISALGLADRVADERCGKVGEEVGYAIRGESRQKTGITKICFVTTGVLLRRLQTSGGSTDDVVKSLADVSHVVIDEVHERSLDTDFLLILLKDVLRQRRDLKLVLMSATLDSATFEKYFQGSCSVGTVEIAGRTHPVADIYLDEIARATGFGGLEIEGKDAEADLSTKDLGNALRAVGTRINYELIAETVRCIDGELGLEDGGILIFLPGAAEIDQTLRALRNDPTLHVLPLHASLQSSEQRRVFQRAPKGMRKVIAATNVAETSITIDDIVAVIDTGKVKETSFDPANNMIKLAEVWASKAACKQRRGRAGRVRAGKCYKLYTHAAEAKMADRPEPEIRRVPLQQLCLSVRAMGVLDVSAFLASALTPPEQLAVGNALTTLQRIGALDGSQLTALGRHLAMIPADLRCAKLMVYGAAFGCLDACIAIAAILAVKSPFTSPKDQREESKAARGNFAGNQGDLLGDLRAYEEWTKQRAESSASSLRRWCEEHYLATQTLFDISTNRKQFSASLKEVGFLSSDTDLASLNQHNDDDNLIRALVAGAFQPQLARIEFPDKKYAASSSGAVEMDPEARTIKFFDEENRRVFIHPSSTLFEAQAYPNGSRYMSYFNKMATSKIFVRDLTPFNVYSLLILCGQIAIDPQGRGLVVDGWLRVKGWARIGVLISRLRIMFDDLLASKIEDPALDISASPVAICVRKLIELNGLDR